MTRFELWKDWYKHCTNSPVYKILVLLRLANSPSFESYKVVKEKVDKHPEGVLKTVTDYKKKKPSDIKWGWYAVYILVIIANSVICSIHGFEVRSWQYWAYLTMMALCFISGAEYRRKRKETVKIRDEVSYLCDRKQCENCSSDDGWCYHTTDIRHAINFEEVEPSKFMERSDK